MVGLYYKRREQRSQHKFLRLVSKCMISFFALVIVGFIFVVFFFNGESIKRPLSAYLSSALDTDVSIGSADFSPIYPDVMRLTDVRFGHSKINELYVEYDILSALFDDELVLNDLYINGLSLSEADFAKLKSSKLGYKSIYADVLRLNHIPLHLLNLSSNDLNLRLMQARYNQEGLTFRQGRLNALDAVLFKEKVSNLGLEFKHADQGFLLSNLTVNLMGGTVSGSGMFYPTNLDELLAGPKGKADSVFLSTPESSETDVAQNQGAIADTQAQAQAQGENTQAANDQGANDQTNAAQSTLMTSEKPCAYLASLSKLLPSAGHIDFDELYLTKVILPECLTVPGNIAITAQKAYLSDVIVTNQTKSLIDNVSSKRYQELQADTTKSHEVYEATSIDPHAQSSNNANTTGNVANKSDSSYTTFVMQGIKGQISDLNLNQGHLLGTFKGKIEELSLPNLQTVFEQNNSNINFTDQGLVFEMQGKVYEGDYRVRGKYYRDQTLLTLDDLRLSHNKLELTKERWDFLQQGLTTYQVKLGSLSLSKLEFLSYINSFPVSIQSISGNAADWQFNNPQRNHASNLSLINQALETAKLTLVDESGMSLQGASLSSLTASLTASNPGNTSDSNSSSNPGSASKINLITATEAQSSTSKTAQDQQPSSSVATVVNEITEGAKATKVTQNQASDVNVVNTTHTQSAQSNVQPELNANANVNAHVNESLEPDKTNPGIDPSSQNHLYNGMLATPSTLSVINNQHKGKLRFNIEGDPAALLNLELTNVLYSDLLMRKAQCIVTLSDDIINITIPKLQFNESSLSAQATLGLIESNASSYFMVNANDFEIADLNSNLINHLLTGKVNLKIDLSSHHDSLEQIWSNLEGQIKLTSDAMLISDLGLDLINGGNKKNYELSGTELMTGIQGSVAGINNLNLDVNFANHKAQVKGAMDLATGSMKFDGALKLDSNTASGKAFLTSLAQDSSTQVLMSGTLSEPKFKIIALKRGEARPGLYLPQYEGSAIAKEPTDTTLNPIAHLPKSDAQAHGTDNPKTQSNNTDQAQAHPANQANKADHPNQPDQTQAASTPNAQNEHSSKGEQGLQSEHGENDVNEAQGTADNSDTETDGASSTQASAVSATSQESIGNATTTAPDSKTSTTSAQESPDVAPASDAVQDRTTQQAKTAQSDNEAQTSAESQQPNEIPAENDVSSENAVSLEKADNAQTQDNTVSATSSDTKDAEPATLDSVKPDTISPDAAKNAKDKESEVSSTQSANAQSQTPPQSQTQPQTQDKQKEALKTESNASSVKSNAGSSTDTRAQPETQSGIDTAKAPPSHTGSQDKAVSEAKVAHESKPELKAESKDEPKSELKTENTQAQGPATAEHKVDEHKAAKPVDAPVKPSTQIELKPSDSVNLAQPTLNADHKQEQAQAAKQKQQDKLKQQADALEQNLLEQAAFDSFFNFQDLEAEDQERQESAQSKKEDFIFNNSDDEMIF